VPARRRCDGVIGQAAGRDEITARQCCLGLEGATARRCRRLEIQVLPGRLACVLRRCNIAGGQGRERHRRVAKPPEVLTKLAVGLELRIGRGASRTHLTLVCEGKAQAPQAVHLDEGIVSRLRVGYHRTELCDGSGQIAFHQLCPPEAHATRTRVGPVTDRIGEIASFFGGRACRDRITGHDRRRALPGEDLAQPPPIPNCAGEADRLGEVRPGCLGVVALASDENAGGQRPGQQGRVVDFARDHQGLLGLIHAAAVGQVFGPKYLPIRLCHNGFRG
jgi:hypothetical protein